MKLLKTKEVKGKIRVITGLHIGAGNEKIEIGGMDNPIIREPLTNMPYIPGSSLKGKIRSLLEWDLNGKHKTLSENGKVHSCEKFDCPICRVFGCASGTATGKKGQNKGSEGANSTQQKEQTKRGPTRLIIRDAFLTKEFQERFQKGEPLVEEKNENSINRITAKAVPRPIERVTSGVEFDFSLLYKIMDTGDGGKTDEDYFEDVVKRGLRLLQEDYLGGSGSRGSGKIEFLDLKDEKGADVKLEETKPQEEKQ